MKKILTLFLTILCLLVFIQKSNALSYEQAYSRCDNEPMVVLVYAQWVNGYERYLQQYRAAQAELKGKYNFVELDITNKEAQAYNNRYDIYRNLPYVHMIRNGGKISRYIDRNCAMDKACIASKLKSFITW